MEFSTQLYNFKLMLCNTEPESILLKSNKFPQYRKSSSQF